MFDLTTTLQIVTVKLLFFSQWSYMIESKWLMRSWFADPKVLLLNNPWGLSCGRFLLDHILVFAYHSTCKLVKEVFSDVSTGLFRTLFATAES
jgi:hypothetical protein